VNGVDFWSEAEFEEKAPVQGRGKRHAACGHLQRGRIIFTKPAKMRGGPDSGTIRADFNLVDPNDKFIAEETKAYTFRDDAAMRTID
jgi:hypothetical protein